MVIVENLIFEYPGFRALKNISFELETGSVTALVGPNGAGKTTLLRCLASLSEPYSGEISINGIDILENPQANHRQTGYLSDTFGLYEGLTVRQNLEFIGSAQKIQHLEPRVEEVIGMLELSEYADKDAKILSRGWRQRLGVAMALLHQPRFLILDEPASGLDPEARIHLSFLIKSLNQQGITLLVSSHILAELEDYSTHLLVMQKGKIIENKKLGAKNENDSRKLLLKLSTAFEPTVEVLFHHPLVSGLNGAGEEYNFHFKGNQEEQRNLLKELVLRDVPVLSLEEEKTNLQDEYLKTVKGL
jgi:ABC-2 type transport system ATP-binding protein